MLKRQRTYVLGSETMYLIMNKMSIVLVLAIITGLSCVTQKKYPILLFNPKDSTKDTIQLWKNMPTPISDFTITPYQAYCIVQSNYGFCQLSLKVIWACHYDENYYYISDAFFRVNKGKQIKNLSRWVDGRTGEIVLPSGKRYMPANINLIINN